MDTSDYIKKYGEPKTLEEILNYCAFISGQSGLEHRTLHHFNYFVSSLIFGQSHYDDFKRAYKDEIPVEGDPEYFGYAMHKGSAEDGLKIYNKYNHVKAIGDESALLIYAKAFKDYCETEYADDTEI